MERAVGRIGSIRKVVVTEVGRRAVVAGTVIVESEADNSAKSEEAVIAARGEVAAAVVAVGYGDLPSSSLTVSSLSLPLGTATV